jgi:hypothetical protein
VIAAAVLGLLFTVGSASARADGQGIVNAAVAMQNAGFPYCFDGGNTNGPTVGITDSESDGSYSNCSQIGRVGFDCTGLTLYAVYQGTGNATLTHDGHQATSGGGQVIGGKAALQPGDIVYFDYNASHGLGYIDHSGVYLGGGNVLSAVSEKWGIKTESFAWYEAGGLHFVGAKRYSGGGSGITEGSFVSHAGFVYRIAGGAPIYVSSWNAVGGAQPTTALSDAQFAALPQYPRDGTVLDGSGGRVFVTAGGAPLYLSTYAAIGGPQPGIGVDEAAINAAGAGVPWDHLRAYPSDGTLLGASGGGVFVVAGGAPLYVSSWSTIGGPQPVVRMDQWDIDNTTNPYAHLRPYPADGTLLGASGGGVFVVAGGAPLYVSDWAAIGGPQPVVHMDEWDIDNTANPYAHLREYPANGTLLGASGGGVFVVAGGAPLYVSNWEAIGGPQPVTRMDEWDIDNPSNPYAHLREYPANGTFLATMSGAAYRIAGGTAFPISSWGLFGGIQSYTTIDGWDVANTSNTLAHLGSTPLDGTLVQGLPSGSFWRFAGGRREAVGPSEAATGVDDLALGAFPLDRTSAVLAGGPGGSSPGTSVSTSGASSHGALPSRTTKDVCIVPNLKHMTVSQVRRALAVHHCELGRVRYSGRKRRPHVIRQSVRANTNHRSEYAIAVTVD